MALGNFSSRHRFICRVCHHHEDVTIESLVDAFPGILDILQKKIQTQRYFKSRSDVLCLSGITVVRDAARKDIGAGIL